MVRRALHLSGRAARRAGIATIGGLVLLLGLALIPLPGPGVLLVVLGLLILSVEFAWASRWLVVVRARTRSLARRWRRAVSHP